MIKLYGVEVATAFGTSWTPTGPAYADARREVVRFADRHAGIRWETTGTDRWTMTRPDGVRFAVQIVEYS